MKPPPLSLDDIRTLQPACLQVTIPPEYADANGHMNMRWYVALFDDAGDALHERLGIHGGTMDLEHHTWFVSEVMPGDNVSVYVRLVAHAPKRVQYVMFLVNETRGRLAAIFECMNAFVDLAARKTAPFPREIAERIEAMLAVHAALAWKAPASGAMGV